MPLFSIYESPARRDVKVLFNFRLILVSSPLQDRRRRATEPARSQKHVEYAPRFGDVADESGPFR
jgi:hypothetical protein